MIYFGWSRREYQLNQFDSGICMQPLWLPYRMQAPMQTEHRPSSHRCRCRNNSQKTWALSKGMIAADLPGSRALEMRPVESRLPISPKVLSDTITMNYN